MPAPKRVFRSQADSVAAERTLSTVSLFCGAGGLDLGFARYGFEPVIAVDTSAAACRTFAHNFPRSRVLKADLERVPPGYLIDRLAELPDFTPPIGVVGGPPCQAFSAGNVHRRRNDPRRKLPAAYARLLMELRKAFDIEFFVFENVLGLQRKDHERTLSNLRGLFKEAGFAIYEAKLDAKDFGVPQTRERMFIVGVSNTIASRAEFAFPTRTCWKYRTVREAIGGISAPLYYARGLSPGSIPVHPNHWCMRPVSKKFSNGKSAQGATTYRAFRVLHWDRPSWTVAYGHREVHVHPSGRRRLSVYEAMLLQGFPSSYALLGTLSAQVQMVSDAVPPPLGAAIARQVLKAIGRSKPTKA
jgi:DNA (cytosine-5)-methyltransferase 1